MGEVNDEMHISEGPHLRVVEGQVLVPTHLKALGEKWPGFM